MTGDLKSEGLKLSEHLQHAERVALACSGRLTPLRRHIYKCLLIADAPLGAYEILGMLDGVGASKPPTVYRSLDWLIGVGLVKKIESISKYIAKTSLDDSNRMALLLCESCGNAEFFDAASVLDSLGNFAREKGFEEHQTVIEILGLCSEHQR
ncbi:transcriptional repressor [Litorimonas haliclonae]|uniref:transcriptional repressor n=1 Tax=Litorimonas haliclonae TaxID=2081977 RepID=UPI0039EFCA29